VTVVFCPQPPLLVPAVSGAPSDATSVLRAAASRAVQSMLAQGPDVVVVVGDGVDGGRFGPGDAGDLRGYGVDLEVPFAGRARPGGQRTPLAHTLGAWLLDREGHTGTRLGVGPHDLADAAALAAGDTAALAGLDPVEGARLLAAGVPVWRAVGAALAGRPVTAHLSYDDAPFGVGYLVAEWRTT
jgi:hypothetical protein